jgi:hypothetical protein
LFRLCRLLVCVALACGLIPSSAFAKRGPPAEIKPIEQDGIKYAVPNNEGRRAYVQAWDVKTDKKLWEADLFRTKIDPNLEEDVQWVFVKSMAFEKGKLKLVDEKGRSFLLDPKTRKVKEVTKKP